jgi:hypothetical protein
LVVGQAPSPVRAHWPGFEFHTQTEIGRMRRSA